MANRLRTRRLLSLLAALIVGGVVGYSWGSGQALPLPAADGRVGATVLQDESTIASDLAAIAAGATGSNATARWLQVSTLAGTLAQSGLDQAIWIGNRAATPPDMIPGLTSLATAETLLAQATKHPPSDTSAERAWAGHVAAVFVQQLLPAERAAVAGTAHAESEAAFDRHMAALAVWLGTHQP